ncbi:MAG: DUF362 domain-containing protein [Candidatus Lokiarchaeia archaeon]
MSEDIDVYRELQKHLDQMPIGYPVTESGVEIRILKHIFTPEEAKIAAKLSWEYEPIEKIYDRMDKTKITIDELKGKLDDMAKKGGIHYKKEDDKKYYANAPLAVGMYEYQVKRLTKEFLEDMKQYITEAFAIEFIRTGVNQLRVIPIEESVTRESPVSTYDDLRRIIESEDGSFCVAECICRNAAEIRGQPCSVTSDRETCVSFGPMAEFYIEQEWGRQVSKEELLEILRRNEEAGLVLQPGNAQRPDFLCSCCGCCCTVLSNVNIFPNPADLFHSNHYAWVDPELCTACETCLDRCQMAALKIVEGVSSVDLGRCIGCGNCVPTCSSEAITLRKKEEEVVPPKTSEDLYQTIKSIKDQTF